MFTRKTPATAVSSTPSEASVVATQQPATTAQVGLLPNARTAATTTQSTVPASVKPTVPLKPSNLQTATVTSVRVLSKDDYQREIVQPVQQMRYAMDQMHAAEARAAQHRANADAARNRSEQHGLKAEQHGLNAQLLTQSAQQHAQNAARLEAEYAAIEAEEAALMAELAAEGITV